ncbi:uncharacterized protein RSE6_12274 [Rhynchosporium secalis]|uniref:Uncharacterized protein n=1 Tax=Rhynchosporium secalis TaxID=38038 RepID=A0A1E1MPY9_RHYSE|nr:uncharacterized protein RSE6_12274 [Rhynchosporium secalis]
MNNQDKRSGIKVHGYFKRELQIDLMIRQETNHKRSRLWTALNMRNHETSSLQPFFNAVRYL